MITNYRKYEEAISVSPIVRIAPDRHYYKREQITTECEEREGGYR